METYTHFSFEESKKMFEICKETGIIDPIGQVTSDSLKKHFKYFGLHLDDKIAASIIESIQVKDTIPVNFAGFFSCRRLLN